MASTAAALGLGLGLTNAYEEKRKALMRKFGLRGRRASIFRGITGFGKAGHKKKPTTNKKHPVKKQLKLSGKKRPNRKQGFRGRGLFDNIQHWVVKNALKLTPLPMIQKALNPTVKKPGWKKARPLQFLPRGVWKAAGVPKTVLDKFEYAKKSDFK